MYPHEQCCSLSKLPPAKWKFRDQSVQPYAHLKCESKVFVARSNVAGLGVFAREDISKGQVACLYTGKCLKCVHGNFSPYLLSTKWSNPDTGKLENWFLDAADMKNACGRYVNDACDYGDIDDEFRTVFYTNTEFAKTCSDDVHKQIGRYYVKVIALEDIVAGEELFSAYGEEYWKKHNWRWYSKNDHHFYRGQKYDEVLPCE